MNTSQRLIGLFRSALQRRALSLTALILFTAVMGRLTLDVRVDFSVEHLFPRFDVSRQDYDRFKNDFPYDDARALVAVEALDLFTPAGLARVRALEQDLARIPGVVDTRGLSTIKDFVRDGDGLRMEKLFPQGDLSPEELQRRRAIATSDPLFVWNLAPPDGHATVIDVTLSREQASSDAGRTALLQAAREVLAVHAKLAEQAGVEQTLRFNGVPTIRAEVIELIGQDLQNLFPLALVVVIGLLYAAFRSARAVLAMVATILLSVIWMVGVMGLLGVAVQVLTQLSA